jgi:predicted acetyltransferase
MISCHKDNPASEHTIVACGGKLDRIVVDPETGKEACIYIITRREKL